MKPEDIEIILRTQRVLEFIAELFDKQLDGKIIFDSMEFYAPFTLLDYDKFHNIVSYLKTQNKISPDILCTLNTIFHNAERNIKIFDKLIEIQTNNNVLYETSFWRINENWEVERLDSRVEDDNISSKKFVNLLFNIFCFKITDFLPYIFSTLVTEDNRQRPPKEPEYDSLFAAFIDPAKYQRIMDYLVSKEFCNSGNNYWTDTMDTLIDLFIKLHIQGYLHRKLSQREMVTISKKTFGIEVSLSSLRPPNRKTRLPDIPLASTV